MNETYAVMMYLESQWDRSDDRAAALKKNYMGYYADKEWFIANGIYKLFGQEALKEYLEYRQAQINKLIKEDMKDANKQMD